MDKEKTKTMENVTDWTLGVTYKVVFNDGTIVDAKCLGGKTLIFETSKGIKKGVDWLNGYISIDEVKQSCEK